MFAYTGIQQMKVMIMIGYSLTIKREIFKNKIGKNGKIEDITIHVIPYRDPLFSVLMNSNGNKTYYSGL